MAFRSGVVSTILCLGLYTGSILQPGRAQIHDVAKERGQFSSQLGANNANLADLALDGDTNPDTAAGHCAQPYDASQKDAAWWMVDLGAEYAIYFIIIHSSTNTQDENLLGHISVRVSDSADISEHTVTEQCALWDDDKFPKESHETLVCDQVMYGRYVSIQRSGGQDTHSMILCEVMVMGRGLDTLCRNCNDNTCAWSDPCDQCKDGYKPPECREACDPIYFGVNCNQRCNEHCKDYKCDRKTGACDCDPGYYGASCESECDQHCKDGLCDGETGLCDCQLGYYGASCLKCSDKCQDTCDPVSGGCFCQLWWAGDRCLLEIKNLALNRAPPLVTDIKDSSAVIRWKKINNVPADLSDHYQYVIEYEEETSSSWVEWQTRYSHDPSSDQYQEATLTGLTYNTVYDVRVKSYRVQGHDREETGSTDSRNFTAKCTIDCDTITDGPDTGLIAGVVILSVLTVSLAGSLVFTQYRMRHQLPNDSKRKASCSSTVVPAPKDSH